MKNTFAPLTGRRSLTAFCLSVCLTLTAWLPGVSAQAAPAQTDRTASAMVRLRGHVPAQAIARAQPLGRTPSRESLSLALSLPLRDPAGLQNLLDRLYTPGDPLFHHFISPAEFAARFSPTVQTYDSVIAYARSRGLRVTGTHPNRLLVNISGSAEVIEAAFAVPLQNYRSPEGRLFHAPAYDPAIPAALAGQISGVIGLDNAVPRRPALRHLRRQDLWNVTLPSPSYSLFSDPLLSDTPRLGSGPGFGYTPSDIKTAYNLSSVTQRGAGRTLALYELDGYDPSDIAQYETNYSLPHVPLENILVGSADGAIHDPNGGAEVTLDIELMTALAPGATKILVYEGSNSATDYIDFVNVYSKIADDNRAKEISTSWGIFETNLPAVDQAAENTVFQQMAAQGQSIYAASGDSGAYDDGIGLSVDDPASQPYMVGVGGTALATNGAGGVYGSETAWSDPSDHSRSVHGGGGGGGVSIVWPLPSYQQGLVGAESTTQRNVPDVCLNADPNTGYSIYYGGWAVAGGTSCAAPLWAAFTALVNQQRAANNETDLGFANPTLYQIAAGADYATGFHDVTSGNNLHYLAGAGYDNATGLGSFNGANLLALLAPAVQPTQNPLSALTLDPNPVVGGLSVTGTVTLVNPAPAGGSTVTLTSANTNLATAPASVTVLAGATTATFTLTTMAVTANTNADITASLSGGTQSATLTLQPAPVVITPASLVLSPASVNGGGATTATLTLSGPAPTSGLTVALSSSDPAATVPATVAVPAGAVSVTFPVTTVTVTAQTTVTLSATLNDVTVTTALTILTPTLEPVGLTPAIVIGGQPSTATLTLTSPALTGGAVIVLSSDTASVAVPASVTIPAGQTTASVTLTTQTVNAVVNAQIKASYNGVDQSVTLTVKPAGVSEVTLTPTSLTGGAASSGVLTLDGPAPAGGLAVTLTSSTASAAVPATVTVAAGATSAAFTVSTAVVSAQVSATITAAANGVTQSAALTILPYLVTSLSIAPQQVVVGTPATGTVTLSAAAPAGGLPVPLSSSSPAVVVPATVLVPAGAATATFTLTTPLSGSAVISATLSGQTQTAALSVSSAPGTSFPAGLSMISVPYDESSVSLDSLFGYSGVKLLTWLPAATQYAATPTPPADQLHLGRGYWVNLPSALTLTHVGTPTDPAKDFSIALSAGWNQIGNPFTLPIKVGTLQCVSTGAAVTFSQATTGSPLLLSSLVYRYVPAQKTVPGSYAWVRDSETLQPGLGYWIFAYSDVTLVVPHP